MRRLLFALALAGAPWITGCDDDATEPAQTADAAPDPDAGADPCADFGTEHLRLLNAPTNATVVRKTPTVPPVDPENLP